MPIAIRMPALGDEMHEGTIVCWRVPVGGRVAAGEVVVLIEADKSEFELDAPAAGVLRHHYAHPGDVVRCGALIAVLTPSPDDPFDPVAFEVEQSTDV